MAGQMTDRTPRIDPDRLRATFEAINGFGANPETGGYNRPGFSPADMAVRAWFAEAMAADGFAVRRDPAGNVFARLGPPDLPCIMIGSHLDTVPEGGAFDGALGVAVAAECARAIRDTGGPPPVPVEVVATSEEEGRFGGMLGSQTIAGAVDPDWLDTARDADGVQLVEAMRGAGLDPGAVPGAAWPPGAVRAFLELHVEQGPLLEAAGVPIGIADRISGVCVLHGVLTGTANHSGSTPMDARADAFAGLAQAAAAIPAFVAERGTDQSRVTIGKVQLAPNVAHTIPGRAEFTVVLRDTDAAVMRRLEAAMREALRTAAEAHGLRLETALMSWLDPVPLDGGLVSLVQENAARLGIPAQILPSGGGHDAQTMQAVAPAGLIFVPSRGGIGHSPEEQTDWDDILRGAELMLATVAALADAP
jgi:N-carbamoyl-L-amino-acid hydrolase